MQDENGEPKRMINTRSICVAAIMCMTLLESCTSIASARQVMAPCRLEDPRDPTGGIPIARSQMFLVDIGRMAAALDRLGGRAFVALEGRDAASYVAGLPTRPGVRAYLVRAGVVTGARLPPAVYYRT